jgi:hypothetical protein
MNVKVAREPETSLTHISIAVGTAGGARPIRPAQNQHCPGRHRRNPQLRGADNSTEIRCDGVPLPVRPVTKRDHQEQQREQRRPQSSVAGQAESEQPHRESAGDDYRDCDGGGDEGEREDVDRSA